MNKIFRIILGCALCCLVFPKYVSAAYQMTPRQAIFLYAKQGDMYALGRLKSMGYSIDMTDQSGNSALCEAVYRQDYSTFSVLKQAGASTTHPCVQRIPERMVQQFNQGYMRWAQAVNAGQKSYVAASAKGASASIVPASSGISVAAVVGATVGVAALVGGGIALASSGGGGGSKTPQDLCAGVVCSVENSVCRAGSCVCKDGYDYHGAASDYTCTPKTVPSGYQQESCGAGYEEIDKFLSGNRYYYKCQKRTCPYNTLYCVGGYEETGKTCQSGETLYKECRAKTCPSDYMEGSQCSTNDDMHQVGEICRSGNKWYVKCVPNEIPENYGTYPCPEGQTAVGEVRRVDGVSYALCETTNECLGAGYRFKECPEHGKCEGPCIANGQSWYKFTYSNCETGWTGYMCDTARPCPRHPLTSCPENAAQCGTCQTGTETRYSATCAEGWVTSATGCNTPAPCEGYNYDECPGNAEGCETCVSGTKTKYKALMCKNGYNWSEGNCVCSGSLTHIPNCKTEQTCEVNGSVRYTCTACESGYNLWNNTCVVCPANHYADNGMCYACPAHSSSPVNAVGADSCVCDSGYEKFNGTCRLKNNSGTDHRRAFSKEEFEAYPNYVNTNTLAPINAAQAYSKFILYDEENDTFDYSALAPVKVIVNDTRGGQQDSSFQGVAPYINFAVDEDGNYDSLSEDNVYDKGGHGNNVASVIAAKWNNTNDYWGVAPNASVYLIGYGISMTKQLEIIQRAVEKGARVFNMSWIAGAQTSASATVEEILPSSSVYSDMFEYLGRNNVVMVQGAGNDGTGHSPYAISAFAGTHEWIEEGQQYSLKNLYIVATGIRYNTETGQYSSYVGNRCGYAQSWCIGAPIGTKTVYGTFVGTSNSTPIVSGAVAFLMGAYPYLTSQQIVEIIYRSADKNASNWVDDGYWTDSLGHVYRTSALYGHGALDLGAATEPMGILSIPTSAGTQTSMGNLNAIQKISVGQTKLALPRVLNSSLTVSLPSTIMGLDDYNRPFAVQTNGLITQAHRNSRSFLRYFRSFMHRDARTITGVPEKMTFEFAPSMRENNLLGMGILDINYRFNDKASLLFSYRSDRLEDEKHFEKSLANPFLDMRNSYALTQRFDLNKRLAFKFNATFGKNGFYEGDDDLDEEYNKSVHAFSSEVDYKVKNNLTFKMIGGLLSEKDAALGMNGYGAFQTDTSQTYFVGGAVVYNPIPKLALSATYYYGQTVMPKTKGIVSFNHIISDSFAFDTRYQFDTHKMVGLQVSSPLRIRKGSAIFNIPVARDLNSDTIYYDKLQVKLQPDAREYDLGFYYAKEADDCDWRGELMARLHPDHMADAKPDYRALFGFTWRY